MSNGHEDSIILVAHCSKAEAAIHWTTKPVIKLINIHDHWDSGMAFTTIVHVLGVLIVHNLKFVNFVSDLGEPKQTSSEC